MIRKHVTTNDMVKTFLNVIEERVKKANRKKLWHKPEPSK